MPVFALNSGRMWLNRPECSVDVVEATTMDLSCARTGAAARAMVAAKTSRLRRVGMVLSSLYSCIAGFGGGSDQQLATHEPARLLGPGVGKERLGRAALDHAAAMQECDLAGEAPRLAEIVRRHHHLDPAPSNGADDVLDRLGRGRIEARGRLVEQEKLRLLGESAREREPLLLAAGELSRRPAAEPGKTDDSGELVDAGSTLRPRHAGGRERITDVAGRAAAEHRRALEHDGAMGRLGGLAASPGHAAVHGRNQAHEQAQQRGLACAVRSDQYGGRAGREGEGDAVEDGHAAGGEADLLKHDRQIGNGRAHAHPANRSPARRKPQAAALTATTRVISTTPSPMASGRLPFDVSSVIAVVMTRVKPSMLPPTMSTAPTSAAARPKPASSAVTRLKRPSQIRVAMRLNGPTSIASSSSRYSVHKSSTVCRVSAATIGVISTVCATIIACGVNRRPHDPSGPARERSRKTTSPTTTGGRPISAFRRTIIASRPRNFVSATAAPNGTPMRAPKKTANRLTRSDRRTIAISAGSAVRMS